MNETQSTAPQSRDLNRSKKIVFGITLGAMLLISVGGGVGTFNNLSAAYGKGTAIGALAAGEGATIILGLLLIGLTMLGRSAPLVIRAGLWALPASAAVMGATAADTMGERIVYALTPMAITAAAEGGAYLLRQIVVYTEGRDAEAEASNSQTIRALAYHQARAAAHPSKWTRKRSERTAWKLARRVGEGDTALGVQLLDVQRTRMTNVADVALTRMFQPGADAASPLALTASDPTAPALPAASAGDAATPRHHDATIREDANGYPADTDSDQQEEGENVRPDLTVVRDDKPKKKSIAGDVRDLVKGGVGDVQTIIDALATRHGRDPEDKRFQSTVARTYRAAKADTADAVQPTGQYL